MVENAARIVRSVDVPVIADADTGYGNELNVFRTVQEYERRGVAAHPHRGPGVAEEVRPSRRQGDRAARGLHREDPRRGRRQAGPRLHDHRAHRRARRRRPRRGAGARQRGAGGRRRHGVRRGAADDGGTGRGAEARRWAVPAERGARRQDAGDRSAAGAADGLSAGDRAWAAAEGGDRRLRRDAGGAEGERTCIRCRAAT